MLIASDQLDQELDASGLYSGARNHQLWDQIPEVLRLVEFSPRTLPNHPAFRWRLGRHPEWRGFDLYSLPEPMQRDFAYCVWRVVEQGLTINHNYTQLVTWLIIHGEDRQLAGQPRPRSLVDLSLSEWERELIRARARRTGKLGWTSNGPATLLPAHRARVRLARVVAARRLEPEVRRADPDPRPRTGQGEHRL